jgi:hypothetical protein
MVEQLDRVWNLGENSLFNVGRHFRVLSEFVCVWLVMVLFNGLIVLFGVDRVLVVAGVAGVVLPKNSPLNLASSPPVSFLGCVRSRAISSNWAYFWHFSGFWRNSVKSKSARIWGSARK